MGGYVGVVVVVGVEGVVFVGFGCGGGKGDRVGVVVLRVSGRSVGGDWFGGW